MIETGKIWMNGKLVPFKDAKVHVLTHALHYSTSIFEGIRCYNTSNGSAIFRLPEHVDRFFKSAKLYSMKMQFSKKEISDAIVKTVKSSRLKECYIRPLAYYGYGTMGLTPTQNKVDVSIACWAWKMGESKAGKFSGAKCKISSWIKIDSRSQPMQAKAAANYSNAALARVEALENGPRDVKGIMSTLTGGGKMDVNSTLHALVDKEFVRKEGHVYQLLEKGRGRLTWLRENP